MPSQTLALARLIGEVTGDHPEVVLERYPNLGLLWLEVLTLVDTGQLEREKCSQTWAALSHPGHRPGRFSRQAAAS